MVWACGKNGWVPYGQNGFDGGSRVRDRPRLGWMDGVKVALGNRGMTVEAGKRGGPWCTCYWMSFTQPFYLALCSFGQPSRALVVITWRGVECRYMMRLGLTVKRAQLLKINAQVSSIGVEGCMLDCTCVIWLDMTTALWWREKVTVYYYYYCVYHKWIEYSLQIAQLF